MTEIEMKEEINANYILKKEEFIVTEDGGSKYSVVICV